jgi:hypothetical protein
MLLAMQGEVAQQWQTSSDSGRLWIPARKRAAAQQKLDAGCDERCSQCRANHRARATQVRHSSARLRFIPAFIGEKQPTLRSSVACANGRPLCVNKADDRMLLFGYAFLQFLWSHCCKINLRVSPTARDPQGPPRPGAQDALLTMPRGALDDQRVSSVAVIWQTRFRLNSKAPSNHLMCVLRTMRQVQLPVPSLGSDM